MLITLIAHVLLDNFCIHIVCTSRCPLFSTQNILYLILGSIFMKNEQIIQFHFCNEL